MESPLLEQENKAWASLLEIHRELQSRLAGKDIKDSWACRRQLRLLEKKKYAKLETALIERCKSVDFCLGDEIGEFVRDLLELATIYDASLVHDILSLIIRLVYQKGGL